VRQGEIYWVELPSANGREQAGRRPAVFVQDENYTGQLPVVLVVTLTTATSTLRFPGSLMIAPTPENGLHMPSVALVFQMRAIGRTRLRDRLGTLNSQPMAELFQTLDKLLGRCEP
jgi:mRNA interferase MazF